MDKLESQTPQEPVVHQFKKPNNFFLVTLPIIFFVAVSLFIAFQIDSSRKTILTYAESLGLYQKPAVKSTFYQWLDSNGKLIISKNKPSHTQDFVVIEADSNLLTNRNKVDQTLLSKSAAFKTQSEAKKGNDEHNTSNDGALSGYARSFNKAKHCIEMAQKVAAVNRELKQDKESNELRARHKKECIDNFEIQ